MTGIQQDKKRKAKNLQYIRTANRAEVIRFLSIKKEATRLELAEHLGLSKMAVSNIVSEMLEEGLVSEIAAKNSHESKSCSAGKGHNAAGPALGTGTSGRKSTRIVLNAETFTAVGIYISRDEIQGVIADIGGKIHRIWRKKLDVSGSADPGESEKDPGESEKDSAEIRKKFISSLFQLTDMIMEEAAAAKPGTQYPPHCPPHYQTQCVGIGVCCIGPLDLVQGTLLAPPNFHGIEQVELVSLLSTRYRLPVRLDNDMNAAAWGEHLYGAGQNCQHVVYLGLTNGIGAGVISYGRIFQGSKGFGGEIGHMSIQMDGPLCPCGQRGCLELYASVPVLLRQTKCPDLETLIRKSQNSEAFRQTWLPSFMLVITTALVNLANIFDPDIILIGHEGAALTESVIADLENRTNQLAFQHRSKKIPVRLARFGEKAPLIGAASLIFQAVFRGELCVSAASIENGGQTKFADMP